MPAPGVSTDAPTTVIGESGNGLNAPASTSTVVCRPSTPSSMVYVRSRTVGRVLAMTRTSIVASNDPVRPYPMRTGSCSVVPFWVVSSAAMLRMPLVMPPVNPTGTAEVERVGVPAVGRAGALGSGGERAQVHRDGGLPRARRR